MKRILDKTKQMPATPDSRHAVTDDGRIIKEDMCCYARNAKSKIVWQITDRCPLSCQYCFTPSRGRKDMDLGSAKKLVSSLRMQYPDKHLMLFAGREPLLYNGIEEIVNTASALDFKCSMSTGGELLTLERAEQLRNAGLSKVNLSINAFDDILHRKTRPHGNLSNVVAAIDNGLAVGFTIKVNITITTDTYDHIANTVQTLLVQGVTSVTIGLLHSVPDRSIDAYKWQYEMSREIRTTLQNCVPQGVDFRLIIPPGPQDCFTHDNCPIRRGLVSILPDGSITGCNIYPDALKGKTEDG